MKNIKNFSLILFLALSLGIGFGGCAQIKAAIQAEKECKQDLTAGGCNERAQLKTNAAKEKIEAKVDALVTPLVTTAAAGAPVPGAGIAAPIVGQVAGKVSSSLAGLAAAPFLFFWFAWHERKKETDDAAKPVTTSGGMG